MSPALEDVRFPGQDGRVVRASLVEPGPMDGVCDERGGVVVVQSADTPERLASSAADRLAEAGLAALVCSVPANGDRAAVADLDEACLFLGERAGVLADGVAVLGFGGGATLAFLAGCMSRHFAAVVDFAGPPLYSELSADRPTQPLEMVLNLDRPLLAFFGAEDAAVPTDHVELLKRSLTQGSKDFEIVTYPHARQGFFDEESDTFLAEAADDAWQRTLGFLSERL